MAASGYLGTLAAIAFDIGHCFTVQGQCSRRIQCRPAHDLSVDGEMQQVQRMGLSGQARGIHSGPSVLSLPAGQGGLNASA